MTQNPKVSIIIPSYNQKRYLKKCVHSICSQSYRNLEIIIVNDGSSDDTLLRAQKFAEDDARILVIDKENGGVASARREGLLAATGEYVAFVDNDDALPPLAIELMLGHAIDKDVDLVIGSVTKVLGIFNKRNIDGYLSFPYHCVVKQPELFKEHYAGFFGVPKFPVSMWGRLFRKSVIDKAMQETDLFPDEILRTGEDEYFNMKLFPYLQSMYRTDEAVYYYRYGGMVDNFNAHFPDLFKLSDYRLKLLDHYQYEAGYRSLFMEYMACYYYHAMQMIQFKKADKAGVMNYFKEEMENRELFPRFVEYFTKHPCQNEQVTMILNKDYEHMYEYAYETIMKRCHAMGYRARRAVLKLIEMFC